MCGEILNCTCPPNESWIQLQGSRPSLALDAKLIPELARREANLASASKNLLPCLLQSIVRQRHGTRPTSRATLSIAMRKLVSSLGALAIMVACAGKGEEERRIVAHTCEGAAVDIQIPGLLDPEAIAQTLGEEPTNLDCEVNRLAGGLRCLPNGLDDGCAWSPGEAEGVLGDVHIALESVPVDGGSGPTAIAADCVCRAYYSE